MDNKKVLNLVGTIGALAVFVLVIVPLTRQNDARVAEAQQAAAPQDAPAPSAQAPAAPPAPPPPATPFDAMKAEALVADRKDLWPFQGQPDTWALYSGTAKDCDGTVISEAPGENDFEKRDNEAKRAELRDAKVGKRYYLKQTYNHYKGYGAGDLTQGDDTHFFYMALGDYDFKKQSFTFSVSTGGQGLVHNGAPWSLGGPDPKWARESTDWVTSKRVGSIGGKAVEVNTVEADRYYVDPSMFTFQWKAAEEEARTWIDSDADIALEIVTTFKGLGFHKKCVNTCMSIFGTRQCVPDNLGVGPYVRNTIDAIRVTTAGKVIYESVNGKISTPAP